jgi:hypothetical protein
MTNDSRLLKQLEQLKRKVGPREAKKIEATLKLLPNVKPRDAGLLVRLHETLLFLRAYPQTPAIARAAETQLRAFAKRVAFLRNQDADLSPLDNPEVSGIAGTAVTDTFTYHIVHWLLRRHPSQLSFDWEWFEDENRLAETWPRFMPLLEEDAFVEANVPYREWLQAARGQVSEVQWLVGRFSDLTLSSEQKAELYDSQKLYVRWKPGFRATRTGMRVPVRKLFCHQESLLQRRDVHFREELEKPPPPMRKLSTKQGEAAIDIAREASTIRYRELYGFTHGDPKHVYKTDLGRGVELFIIDLPPEKRLPLRVYHAAMIYKNGVPIGYFEGLSLFERMESGFNLYYTFREGETAWLYARILNVMRCHVGVTAFSLDPYQIGFGNEEGIESGAFWFYRKLGFRPTRPALFRLTQKEELRISKSKRYRTSSETLRKLAEGPMILQLNKEQKGDWDRFQLRNIGLAVQRRMPKECAGDAERMRATAVRRVEQTLGVRAASFNRTQRRVFSDFALVLSLLSDLKRWSAEDKQQLFRIVRAKVDTDEIGYLKEMQQHARLRKEMIKLGSWNKRQSADSADYTD